MVSQGLNKRSHVPLYRQLYALVAGEIRNGTFEPGERIPSERELASDYRVSRTTARLAIDDLVASGLVYREQGKGTFVAEPRMNSVMGFTSFSEDMRARGFVPQSRVLKQELIAPDADLRQTLKVEGGEQVLHLVRLRLASDRAVAIQSSYLPLQMVPGLEQMELDDKSLFNVLREQYYIYPGWTEAEMEALRASEEQAQLLEIQPGAPVLVVRGLTYTDTFDIVESVETVYRGEGLALYWDGNVSQLMSRSAPKNHHDACRGDSFFSPFALSLIHI